MQKPLLTLTEQFHAYPHTQARAELLIDHEITGSCFKISKLKYVSG